MTDPQGAVALAERLHKSPMLCAGGGHGEEADVHGACGMLAAAILGERGVFLPDGHGLCGIQDAMTITEQAATIAALRAALEPAQRLVDVIFAEAQAEPFILPVRGMRAAGDLRAALTAAKETP